MHIILQDIFNDINKVSKQLTNAHNPIKYKILEDKLEALENLYTRVKEVLEGDNGEQV